MMAQRDHDDGGAWSPHDLALRVAKAEDRARASVETAAVDLSLDDAGRLDDRMRVILTDHIHSIVAAAEAEVRRHTLRLLADQIGTDQIAADRARALLVEPDAVPARLSAAGLSRDAALLAELMARVRQDMLVTTLPIAPGGPDEPSLLVRLSLAPDAPVARAAAALMAADSRRRDQFDRRAPDGRDLPLPLYTALTWWVAAAMRTPLADPARDRALAEAASRGLAAHEEGERSDTLALRLIAAIDPRPAEIASLLVEAIGDRRPGLFAAILSYTLGLPFDQARAILLEPEGDRLWLALRALKLDRTAVARIGLSLAEAQPARDVAAFAGMLDTIMAVPPEEAHAALEPMTLDPVFRSAMAKLDRIAPIGGAR